MNFGDATRDLSGARIVTVSGEFVLLGLAQDVRGEEPFHDRGGRVLNSCPFAVAVGSE